MAAFPRISHWDLDIIEEDVPGAIMPERGFKNVRAGKDFVLHSVQPRKLMSGRQCDSSREYNK